VIRAILILILLAVIVAGGAFVVLAGEPGRASVEWLGWRVDMTAAAAVTTVLIGAFLAVSLWRIGLWIIDTPRRNARVRAETRRRQGAEALTRGFLAAAAGDGSEARRLAQRAAELVQDTPALVRVLAAQAAEAAGDHASAHAAYTAMLGFPEMRLAGRKGLMQTALAIGDREGALRQAQAAYELTRTARWAWRALLEDRLEAGDWSAALELVRTALDRKIVSPISAERARAALLAASAASIETSADPRQRAEALEFASRSARLNPGFAPGVAIAVRLLQADGKPGRASALIEQAWKLEPHPALWLAWRDLRTAENPKERAARFAALAALNPEHRESRFLLVEQSLLLREPVAARAVAEGLLEPAPSARVCALMARVAGAGGLADEARAWMTRGLAAPQEPPWTDLDPDGRAFSYSPADWARLVATYSETGELIHPRFERRERSLSELPELPASYEAAAPFMGDTAALAMAPDDPGPYADGFHAAPPPDPGPPAAVSGPRRLASPPRAAK
jgi:HemY protein